LKSLACLPRHVKANAVERAGALGAGRAAAWSGAKRMALDRSIHSVRLGLHHRMLFSLEGDELVIAEVISRKELEGWLSRR
jgi:hypothetical protein